MEARTGASCQQGAGNSYGPRRQSEQSCKIPIAMLLTPSPEAAPERSLRLTRDDSRSSSSGLSQTPSNSSSNSYSKPGSMDSILNGPRRSDPTPNTDRSAYNSRSPDTDAYSLPPETLDLVGRKPRAPRPSYSEEQKFFIMYARIVRDLSWPEIEDEFERFFGSRSKGGLTSVYYRVRRDWGLLEVLKSGSNSYQADCKEVERRAMNFSTGFLSQIGYLAN